MTAVWIVVLSLLGIYLLALFALAWITLRPFRIPLFLTARALGLPQESVEFQTSDGITLRGWWLVPETPRAVIVLSHGYVMNRAEGVPLAKRMFEEGFAVLLYDLRAHGYSGGKRTSLGWAERYDVAAALNLAEERFPQLPRVAWGSSMGAAATVFALSQKLATAQAAILDSVYSRLSDANDGWWHTFLGPTWKEFAKPVKIICRMMGAPNPAQIDVARALPMVPCPLILLYGETDLIVPTASQQRNRAAVPQADFALFSGCQHSQPRWVDPDRYDDLVLGFLKRIDILS